MTTIQELTEKMDALVRAKGWWEANTSKVQAPRNLACSLAIEAAEVLEHFQWGDSVTDREALGLELADVFLYLLQLAHVSGIDLEEATLKKIELNYQRSWD